MSGSVKLHFQKEQWGKWYTQWYPTKLPRSYAHFPSRMYQSNITFHIEKLTGCQNIRSKR